MTQPTIAELRAMAERERTQAMFDGHAATVMIIDAFLRYTDDRPLTADDCDKTGSMRHYEGGKRRFTEARSIVVYPDDDPWMASIETCAPTVGQLNLALDLERERAAK